MNMKELICKHCGKPIELYYINNDELIEAHECFDCNFWMKHLEKDRNSTDHTRFVEECKGLYRHYVLCPPTDKGFKGFYGKKVKVTFPDGTVVENCNMWHQGNIPKHFIEDFKPFLAKLEWL